VPKHPDESHQGNVLQARQQLEEADVLRQQGKLDRAESLCYALTRRYPNYVAAFHTLGLVYLDKREFEQALNALVRAAMFDPQNWRTLTALSLAYLRLGAGEKAARTLQRGLAIKPDDPSIFASLGEIHREDREYEMALDNYRKALALDPALISASIGLSICLSATGQTQEAAHVLEQAFRRGDSSLHLMHHIAMLPFSIAGIDVLQALDVTAAQIRGTDAKNTTGFARASALEKSGRHAEAWQELIFANRPLAATHRERLKVEENLHAASLARLRSASAPAGGRHVEPSHPISLFVLGASRSGKTSLERLITCLQGVKAGFENPIVETALRRTLQAAALPPADCVNDLPPALLQMFGKNYLAELDRRAGPARVFTNTLPGRIDDILSIASAIPNVRVILIKRARDDTALRIYMTKYLKGNYYSYDLAAIRRHLARYDEMIDLVTAKLPGQSEAIGYEDMADSPADILHKVASLCGLQMTDKPLQVLAFDVGCAAPSQQWMRQS